MRAKWSKLKERWCITTVLKENITMSCFKNSTLEHHTIIYGAKQSSLIFQGYALHSICYDSLLHEQQDTAK